MNSGAAAGGCCYWTLLKQDERGVVESASAKAASSIASLAESAPSTSSSDPERLFRLVDASLRGFLVSQRCLTKDSERYSVEARSQASAGRWDASFKFLGRALEVRRESFFPFFESKVARFFLSADRVLVVRRLLRREQGRERRESFAGEEFF